MPCNTHTLVTVGHARIGRTVKHTKLFLSYSPYLGVLWGKRQRCGLGSLTSDLDQNLPQHNVKTLRLELLACFCICCAYGQEQPRPKQMGFGSMLDF
jgi:hypothetical protein